MCNVLELGKSPQVLDADIQQDEEIRRNWRSGFSWFSIRRLKQLRIGWPAQREATVKEGKSIVFSANSEYIAILFQNQVTILSKDDNYTDACGTFTALPESEAFLYGVWVDNRNILAVSDSLDTIYFLKPNGEELTRIPKNHLQATGAIIGLFVWEDQSANKYDRYHIIVITADCILHQVVVDGENIAIASSSSKPVQQSKLRKQHPFGISCSCFHRGLSMLVLAGPIRMDERDEGVAGIYGLSVWRLTKTSDLELICFHSQLRGVLCFPKSHSGPFFSPKLIIASCGRHLAVLDLTENLCVLTLEGRPHSDEISLSENIVKNLDEGITTASLHGIRDIAWWSKGKLLVVKTNGSVNVVDIPSFNNILEEVPLFSSPVVGKNQQSEGHIFVLETLFSEHLSEEISESVEPKSSEDVLGSTKNSSQTYPENGSRGVGWKLISLLEQSASQKYKILINGQKYEAAHQFAIQQGLDKDEVFKSLWLHSDYGKESIQKYLPNIEDRSWVLSECIDKVGSSVDSIHAILSYGLLETENNKFEGKQKADSSTMWKYCTMRLRLLQYNDRLETFLGVNMGRFYSQDYADFRRMPLNKIAIALAESGKIGALNLLFNRHSYSLAPFILQILNAFPETIPVHNYDQLLPGLSPPKNAGTFRDEDWVENQEMLSFIESHSPEQHDDIDLRMSTENMVKLHRGLVWPSASEIVEWYKERARAIDKVSGQLENSLSLVDIGQHKGILELRGLLEDISDLYHVVFSGIDNSHNTLKDIDLSLSTWEQLNEYEKFKIMLDGFSETTVVERLRELAIPFMHRKLGTNNIIVKDDSLNDQSVNLSASELHSETYLVRWLKEIAEDNQLELCSVIIEEGCKCADVNWFFKDETEMIEVGLHCIYTCTHTDKWSLMASLLSKLPRNGLRSKHSSVVYDDFSSRQGFRKGLERVLGQSSGSVSSNSKVVMSPLFFDEEDSSHPTTSRNRDVCDREEKGVEVLENLEKRLRVAEDHVEVGRLLTNYQVARPIKFFLEAHGDEKGVKQLLRLLLSKFGRRQQGRTDGDWALMWHDMQCFQEKAFPFLDTEYMLMEFCRGLLKAGKFSLARNYLNGIPSTPLAMEKAEKLVLQAAREYFYSASTLDCLEIWKAKECLDLLPNSKQVKAEADMMDAITVKLPKLGVSLLPMQFRQIRDPMDIVKMAVVSQTGDYLKVEELIEVGRLLGLTSPDDIAVVEAAIAREAGATGDLQLAVELCLSLVRKDHGPIWDLCAALGRGPDLDKMDFYSRKELLGFALGHCDEESIGELLHAWKEINLANQCEDLGKVLGKKVSTLSDQEAFIASFPVTNVKQIIGLMERTERGYTESIQETQHEEAVFKILKDALSSCTEKFISNGKFDWDALLHENKRFMSFAALQLPWLLELNKTSLVDLNGLSDSSFSIFARDCSTMRARALAAILYWLGCNNIVPKDNLIASIAKMVMERSDLKDSDLLGCSYLLNLLDPHFGVEVIEDALRTRKEYDEVHSAMNIGLLYSSLHGSSFGTGTPEQRRRLLSNNFWDSHSTVTDCMNEKEEIETTFWKEWRLRIAEQQRLAQQARLLEQMIPGVETRRFLSGDTAYVQNTVFSLIESVKIEKKSILSKGLMLANMYRVDRSEVLIRYLSSALISEVWTNEDIEEEISEHWNELFEHDAELLKVLSSTVYPTLDTSNKRRLTFLYKILSSCYVHLKERLDLDHLLGAEDEEILSGLKNELLNFIKTMITAGCSFRTLTRICFQGRPIFISDSRSDLDNYTTHQKDIHESRERLASTGRKDENILKDIMDGYVSAIDSALSEICGQTSDSAVEINKFSSRNLCKVLSSLAGADYDDDDVESSDSRQQHFVILQRMRRVVWSKLTAFAEDLQLPGQVRVYLLEILQCIAGRGHMHASGAQHDSLLPWDQWDAFQHMDIENLSEKENQSNANTLRSTLVALKSKELISTLWPGVEVNGKDLVSVDSSVSLFCVLAANAVSKQHILTLISLLKEWECLFENVNERSETMQTEDSKRTTDEQDNWSEEAMWDDGWEALEDLKVETNSNVNKVVSVHTYHMCWHIILDKLVEQCELEDVLMKLDEACSNKAIILLTEDEARRLTAKLSKLQPAIALKSALLLPYDSLWFETLEMFADKLKEIRTFDSNGQESNTSDVLNENNISDGLMDNGLLALILYAGLLPSIAGNPKFITIFSYMCALLGQLVCLLQENYLSLQRKSIQVPFSRENENESLFLCDVAFPIFIAELTRGKHYFLAGTMVFQFMHVHPTFYSMDGVYVALKRYLEMQMKVGQVKYQNAIGAVDFPHGMKNIANGLREKLPSMIKTAFSTLSKDVK
ncbi:hypothetical protein SUGI_0555830 [Cryptomeria japonica]|nr:hypothetical protein SUGI_0555830 [Cryptomeria japonica]